MFSLRDSANALHPDHATGRKVVNCLSRYDYVQRLVAPDPPHRLSAAVQAVKKITF